MSMNMKITVHLIALYLISMHQDYTLSFPSHTTICQHAITTSLLRNMIRSNRAMAKKHPVCDKYQGQV